MARPQHDEVAWNLTPVARAPGMRALAWDGDVLYASRGYQLFRARIEDSASLAWISVAHFRPAGWRRFTSANRFTRRLCRDGFHALAVLPSGGIVAAVAGAIVALPAGGNEFRLTHAIARGTRPLHVTATPDGRVLWGEYFDNARRDEVRIFSSHDGGFTWQVAHTFPRGQIRHVHNIVYDPWENCLWVLTGDYGDECRILRASCDLSQIESVLRGNQQARAVALVPMPDGLYFSSDTPLESNYLYRLDRARNLFRLFPISSSSIYGCRVGDFSFFATMVEPSEVNRDPHVRIYGGAPASHPWRPLLEWKKDPLSMSLFQFGNAFLPDGNNSTPYLAVTPVAVTKEDQVLLLYRVSG